MKNYKQFLNKKNQFLKGLKESFYTDKLINKWMETFTNDNNVKEYIKAIEFTNKQWYDLKKIGHPITIQEYVERMINNYKEQGLPVGLIHPIFISCCTNIKDEYYRTEFMKNTKIYQKDGVTYVDMSK